MSKHNQTNQDEQTFLNQIENVHPIVPLRSTQEEKDICSDISDDQDNSYDDWQNLIFSQEWKHGHEDENENENEETWNDNTMDATVESATTCFWFNRGLKALTVKENNRANILPVPQQWQRNLVRKFQTENLHCSSSPNEKNSLFTEMIGGKQGLNTQFNSSKEHFKDNQGQIFNSIGTFPEESSGYDDNQGNHKAQIPSVFTNKSQIYATNTNTHPNIPNLSSLQSTSWDKQVNIIPSTFPQYTNDNKKYNLNLNTPRDNKLKIPNHSNDLKPNTRAFFQKLESLLISNKKINQVTFALITGNICSIIKNQQASRLCQYYLDNTSNEILHSIFMEIFLYLGNWILDPYANYFCLKLFYFLSFSDRRTFLWTLHPIISQLSINKIATHPIQCIVENIKSIPEQKIIIKAWENNYISIATDVYGTHVLDKIWVHFDYNTIKTLRNFIVDHFFFWANHPNGLCIIKRIIVVEYQREHYTTISNILSANGLILIQNPYGNYAWQTALDHWREENVLFKWISVFANKCWVLSLQKYSSNVIEKCILHSKEFCFNYIKEVINRGDCTIKILIQNNHGNYVLQTLFKTLKEAPNNSQMKAMFFTALNKVVCEWNDVKLFKKWKKLIDEAVLNK